MTPDLLPHDESWRFEAETYLMQALDHHYDEAHGTDEDGVTEDFEECASEMIQWLEDHGARLVPIPDEEMK